MKKYISVSILLLSIICSAFAEEESVVTLTKSNFDDVIKQNQFVLVEFYAPWCGHCKKLAPEYEKAAKNLQGEAVLAKVDATVETELANQFGIRGYPTIKFFKNGELHTDYSGGRTAESIAAWIKKVTGPASTLLSTKEGFDAFLASASLTHVVAFVQDEKQASVFLESVDTLEYEELLFAHVTDKDLIETLNQKPGTIVVFQNGNTLNTYSGDFTKDSVKEFINKDGYPRLEKLQLTPDFVGRINRRQRPLVIVARDEKKSKQSLDEQLEFAKKLSESNLDASFVEFNSKDNPTLAKQWGASGNVFPTVILLRFVDRSPKLTAFNEEKELSVDSALQWIEGCISGKECEGHLRSEPIPEKNDEPVKVVVGKTFKDIVYDESKDVVVEFYSPTCPHCKNIVGPYNEFAKTYENDDGVLVTKIDATVNSYPDTIPVQGYPTILLFRANDKSNPLKFEKERTAEKFREFVEENRFTKKTVEENKKDEL